MTGKRGWEGLMGVGVLLGAQECRARREGLGLTLALNLTLTLTLTLTLNHVAQQVVGVSSQKHQQVNILPVTGAPWTAAKGDV